MGEQSLLRTSSGGKGVRVTCLLMDFEKSTMGLRDSMMGP